MKDYVLRVTKECGAFKFGFNVIKSPSVQKGFKWWNCGFELVIKKNFVFLQKKGKP